MKILFSADWHIKLGQKNVPRDWQNSRYNLLFKSIIAKEANADIHILGGDVFDTVPKPDEMALFLKFVSMCTIPTYIYDGNHEATRKGKTFLIFFKDIVTAINPLVKIVDGIEVNDMIGVDFIPYTHIRNFNPDDFHNDICCTHVRGNIPPHVIEEVDLAKFDRWQTVLAGDLHSNSNSQRNIIYPGSPLSITFHRSPITSGIIIFDTVESEYEFIDLELPQLLRKTVRTTEEIVKTIFDHTIYELKGSIEELGGIDSSSDLIDKKIINKNSESVLNLLNLSIEGELSLYLKKVQKLSDDYIKGVLKTYNDYDKESTLE